MKSPLQFAIALVLAIQVSPSAQAWLRGSAALAQACNYSTAGPDCAPGVRNILLAGGVADMKDVTVTTTIGSGSPTLTVGTATFASADCQSGAGCTGTVNKAIGVWGAGTSSGILSTTITGFTSSTVVTLATNAGTAVSGASKEIRFGTDNTTAIQAAATALGALGGGSIYFPAGSYLINGSCQAYPNSLVGSSIILLPDRTVGQGPININLIGQFPAPYGGDSVIGAQTPPTGGSIIATTRNNSGGISGVCAMIGGGSANAYPFTFVNLGVANLLFRTYDNPKMLPVDARYVAGLEMDNVWIDAGTDPNTLSLPTDVNAQAITTPLNNNGAFTKVENINIIGYYIGVQVNEHSILNNVNVYQSNIGYYVKCANHAMHMGRVGAYHVKIPVQFPDSGCIASVGFEQLDIEWTNSGPFVLTNDIDDPNSVGYGPVNWHLVQANVGITHTLTVNGGANLRLQENGSANVNFSAPAIFGKTYAVSGLPTCNAAAKGSLTVVTDATSPTYNAALTGSGAVVVPVFCNGSAWVSH